MFVLPVMHGGGAERVAAQIANEMHSRGIKVTFVLTSDTLKQVVITDLSEDIPLINVQDSLGKEGTISKLCYRIKGLFSSLLCKPFESLGKPVPADFAKLSLSAEYHREIRKMKEIIGYIHSDHIYKGEVLRMLYSIFLLDLQNAQQRAIVQRQTPQRVEEIFIGFIRLLPRHFAEHHDIPFYADQLHISPVYLSRVVRQVTGRTVVDYINQMLLMEASFLLQTSQLSITQIADHLHFADTPSFSKFFSRLNGMSPKEYRKG